MHGPLTDKQFSVIHQYNEEQPNHIILEGAVRSGKTHCNNILWIRHIGNMPQPRKDFVMTGYTIGSLERNVIAPLSDFLGITIRLDQFGRFDFIGHKVNCFGANTETAYKAMTGLTGYGWYANEVAMQHRNTVTEAFQRCSGQGTKIFWDTNPDHPYHYVKTDYVEKSGMTDGAGNILIRSVHFELDDNELLSPEYVEQIKRATPKGMWYDRRIKGLWVAAEGIIYESFRRDEHTCDPFPIPKDWQRVRGIDFGTVHPFVMLWGAIDPDGRLYIYREYYKTNTLIKQHAEKIKELSGDERYLWTVSDHDLQERIEYEAKDIPTMPANKAVKLGLDLTAQRMVKQVDGRPRVMIFNTCTELIRQLGTYSWLPFEEGKPYREEPLKVDDDGPDVLRYIVMELDYSSAPIIEAGFRGYRPRG
jgi:phage terminase large subunit